MLLNNLSFDNINNALQNINAMTETSEAHGTLCGIACISGASGIDNWLDIVLEEQDSNNLQLHETRRILTNLYESTHETLANNSYSMKLLVHSDDAPLDIRLDDLSLWCQGFLYGLSVAGLNDIKKLPGDAAEILQDMSDISKVAYSQEDEDSETAFAEIVEYVRVGVYIVYNTFNDNEAASPSTNTVH